MDQLCEIKNFLDKRKILIPITLHLKMGFNKIVAQKGYELKLLFLTL